MPSSLSTAKYAQGGELFARMELEDDLSEDSMAGRLILMFSQVAWIAEGKKEKPVKVAVLRVLCERSTYLLISVIHTYYSSNQL